MPILALHESVPGVIAGTALLLFGVGFMRAHVLSWRRTQADTNLGPAELTHYRVQYRRRMQTSGMIALMGILVAVGDALVPWQEVPTLFVFYWGGIILLAVWVTFLALGDMTGTRRHSRGLLNELHRKQAELEREAARLRAIKGNGHSD